ncbi:MAG TPA: helix-hairpin-helix domain-containing protein [Myxococcota bacterium]|nr:helix-hairpin-helix domain-containing protein [Myxococcota bacterium]
MARGLSNVEIADALERIADLLEAQDAEGFRVRAYRHGAERLRATPEPVAALYARGGVAALDALPEIGKSLASVIAELVRTGRSSLLERLLGQVSPEDRFTTVAGIGEELARRVHAQLGIESLEDLELAAHDGRLAQVPGFGARRVRAVQQALAGILGRESARRGKSGTLQREGIPGRPDVATLLDVDREYRRKAGAGELRTITPRRFNPGAKSWLPVLHTQRGPWTFTALFSNTARAHQLGTTGDWVVIYFERDGREGQCTVVTEHAGPRAGTRVVRGRENEG